MQTLGEILRHDDPAYLRYLSRKTQYLISREKSEYVHRFWQHLIIEHHPQQVLPALAATEKKTLALLLKNFAHDGRAAMRPRYQKLEKKIPWVLQHPDGAYFIPFEIIKTLMPQRRLVGYGYLFQLLYAMPEAEQHSLRALLARSHRSREALGHEKHALDRALALYIWTADHRWGHKNRRKFSSARNIWQHLAEEFPRLADELAEWRHLMETGHKGFYRSLSLIRGRGAELLKSYATGLAVVPVTTRRQKVFPAQNLKFMIPLEFQPDKAGVKHR
ncbi:MAG: hypothetical protein J0L53_00605 [Spirochaetes bacterium]|nr:hypothetical protein [Spirochaetota bacterium]